MKFSRFVLAGLLAAAPLSAQTAIPGAKAEALGGAFVADGTDAVELWGNPGLLTGCALGCANLFGGAVATDQNGFARKLEDDFSGVDFSHLSDPSQLSKIPGIVADLESFSTPGTGTIGSGAAGIAYARRGFAIGIGETVFASAYPTVDLVHVTPSTIAQNDSRVSLRGLEAREARVAYASEFFLPMLHVGATVRYVQARTYSDEVSPFAVSESAASLLRDALRRNERTSSAIAFDIGAVLTPLPKLRVGLVGESLNQPSFDIAECPAATAGNPNPEGPCATGSVVLPRVLRAGAAFAPTSFDGVVFAVDADLNHQKTLVPGLTSRRVGGGAQIYFVRVGAFRDLDAVDPHWAYTAGLNLSFHFVALQVSGVYSTHRRDAGASAEVRLKL